MKTTKTDELTKRLFLIMLKYLPVVTALCYMANTIAAYFGLNIHPLSNIGGMSLISWLFAYISSSVFNFCIYHKLFLWYIFADDSINIADYYCTIAVDAEGILMVHGVIICMVILICSFLHVKQNKILLI